MNAHDASPDDRWADHQAIVELLYRYSDIVTRGAWAEDAELFTAGAVVEIASPFDVKIAGADAICAWRAGSASLEFLMHTTFSPTVRFLDADRATATSQTREMVRGQSPAADPDAHALNTVFYSVYYDDIVNADGA